MKKVLIDINACTLRKGQHHLQGIGRSTLNLLIAFSRHTGGNFSLRLYTQYMRSRLPERDRYKSLPLLHIPLPGHQYVKDLVVYTRLREALFNYDLLHVPHNYERIIAPERTVVTIHDTFCCTHPDMTDHLRKAQEKQLHIAQSCKAITTCSIASKRDIVYHLRVPPDKVRVIHWGIDTGKFYREDKQYCDQVLSAYGIKETFFLTLSCGTGRKNTPTVMYAGRILCRNTDTRSVLILLWESPPTYILEDFSPELASGKIKIIPAVDDKTLRVFYSSALATVYLSRYEGFGFVPLESMACGTPVILGRNSALPEVAGDKGIYVNIEDKFAIAERMASLLSGNIIIDRHHLIEHARHFNWDETAVQYLDFYQQHLK